ncbi:GYF domain-containing protein [Flavobacterium coralii]|uniref:DUF4339 domain-containing protein n=1 Tax=Flavobacterium coralii TaxID=2838017 RepID=UPI000C4CD576|nr:hypothetical protein [Flavobacterium sp.]|tara:strand:+ start:1643 stop:2281 length:639 start_codon:yes stop_codon:yes gene_type:complete
MRQYYLHQENKQSGPFTITELKFQNISRDTMIWYEGLENWVTAGTLSEINSLFSTPPPLHTSHNSLAAPAYVGTSFITKKTDDEEKRIIGLKPIYFYILAVLIAAIVLFSFLQLANKSAQQDLRLRQIKYEQNIQNRKKQITDLNNAIDVAKQNLAAAEYELQRVSEFRLFRTRQEREQQVEVAESAVIYAQQNLETLEVKLDYLHSNPVQY